MKLGTTSNEKWRRLPFPWILGTNSKTTGKEYFSDIFIEISEASIKWAKIERHTSAPKKRYIPSTMLTRSCNYYNIDMYMRSRVHVDAGDFYHDVIRRNIRCITENKILINLSRHFCCGRKNFTASSKVKVKNINNKGCDCTNCLMYLYYLYNFRAYYEQPCIVCPSVWQILWRVRYNRTEGRLVVYLDETLSQSLWWKV